MGMRIAEGSASSPVPQAYPFDSNPCLSGDVGGHHHLGILPAANNVVQLWCRQGNRLGWEGALHTHNKPPAW